MTKSDKRKAKALCTYSNGMVIDFVQYREFYLGKSVIDQEKADRKIELRNKLRAAVQELKSMD